MTQDILDLINSQAESQNSLIESQKQQTKMLVKELKESRLQYQLDRIKSSTNVS